MKQEVGSKNCVAIVACMATGCSVEEFEAFIGDCGEGYSDIDFYKFLVYKGYALGCGFKPTEKEFTHLRSELDIKTSPAYITCKSTVYPGHVLYWDGNMVYDPSPHVEDGKPLSFYELIDWFPINKIR